TPRRRFWQRGVPGSEDCDGAVLRRPRAVTGPRPQGSDRAGRARRAGARREPVLVRLLERWKSNPYGWLRSELDLLSKDLPPHHPVPRNAVRGVGKGRRAVLLEERMAHPGESVPREEARQEEPPFPGHERSRCEAEPEARPDEVEPPTGPIAML